MHDCVCMYKSGPNGDVESLPCSFSTSFTVVGISRLNLESADLASLAGQLASRISLSPLSEH